LEKGGPSIYRAHLFMMAPVYSLTFPTANSSGIMIAEFNNLIVK
jgi:hypothetical protein